MSKKCASLYATPVVPVIKDTIGQHGTELPAMMGLVVEELNEQHALGFCDLVINGA